MGPKSFVVCLLILCLFNPTATAEDWPQFRGPHYNGSTTEKNLPTDFSQSEKVVWKFDLPGASAATPAIFGDNIFVSATNPDQEKLLAMCLNRKNGKVKWQKEVADGLRRDSRSNYAAPTPATDGEVAIFFYGTGDLVAFDYAGKELWKRNLQKDYGDFCFQWTFSTSPLLHDGTVYMQVLQRDRPVHGKGFKNKPNESYLMAIDAKTGENRWRIIRPSEAEAESLEAFTTPLIHEIDGKEQLLVIGGDDLTGHDPKTGEELWRWGTWNPTRIGHWRHVPSPVIGDGVVLACAPKKDPIYAIQTGGKGDLSDDAIAWVSKDTKELSSDVPTPAFYDGDFFVLSDVRKSLARVEPKTGKVKWKIRTPGTAKYEASPLVADGKIYLINFVAEVVIFDANTGEQINMIKMDNPRDDSVRSSVVAAGGQLFIKTSSQLFCIEG